MKGSDDKLSTLFLIERWLWSKLEADEKTDKVRDHPYITSVKRLSGWGQYYLGWHRVGGSEKVQKCADVIQGLLLLSSSLRNIGWTVNNAGFFYIMPCLFYWFSERNLHKYGGKFPMFLQWRFYSIGLWRYLYWYWWVHSDTQYLWRWYLYQYFWFLPLPMFLRISNEFGQ